MKISTNNGRSNSRQLTKWLKEPRIKQKMRSRSKKVSSKTQKKKTESIKSLNLKGIKKLF